jgi:DNA-binding SARP family transcriptional activator
MTVTRGRSPRPCPKYHPRVTTPPTLADTQLAAIDDPAALLERAWALEPAMRLSERRAALDRLERLLTAGAPPAPSGRCWELELLAERAIDQAISTPASTSAGLDETIALAERVLREADATYRIALARATWARGRALGWLGTEDATRRADRVLIEAAERFGALRRTDWQGFATFWRGYAVHFQNGRLREAVALMREALDVLGEDSPRRSTVLDFYADALIEVGELEAAGQVLDEAVALAERDQDRKAQTFAEWTRAHIASARGDVSATERLLHEVERNADDWFETHIGAAFLTDAAEMLDRVGLREPAEAYLARAIERLGDHDEAVRQARAMMLARTGDPWQALDALQELTRGDWLEKRYVWRFTLLTAWATFRAGRDGAGELAARALEQAVACGGIGVARTGEPDLVAALAPLAERAGSAHAREMLAAGRTLIVRLFGTPAVVRADGTAVQLPAGMPGELVRMLAIREHGMPVDAVLDALFADAPPSAARQRLRQVLTRLRSAAGELVMRDGDLLRLVPAWIDVREFLVTANRVRAINGPRSLQLAYAALALYSPALLASDPYAAWTEEIRAEVEYRHLALLDQIASAAAARGSHQEALTALEAAMAERPDDERYLAAVGEQLRALGRHRAAEHLAQRLSRAGE